MKMSPSLLVLLTFIHRAAAQNVDAIEKALADLQEKVTAYSDAIDSEHTQLNQAWLIFGAAFVFFMQAGFAMVEAGSVRLPSVSTILFKNLMDGVLSALLFYSFGWGFYRPDGGDAENAFIAGGPFFLSSHPEDNFAGWLFQWAFTATAATIVSGAVAERCRLSAYFFYTALLCAFVYPVVAHWGWSSCGWASAFNSGENPDCPKFGQIGVIDFAGSGIVHMTGGFAALAGAIILGPRKAWLESLDEEGNQVRTPKYRFSEGIDENQFKPHSIPHQAIGVMILWFGWYGFNCASTLSITAGAGVVASRVACTTTLGAAFGGVGALLFNRILVAFRKRVSFWDIGTLLNGILAGLVSVTAPCAVIEPWAAMIIGIIGGMVYVGASIMLKGLQIDDPLDAFPVHGAGGLWGLLSVGFFAHSEAVKTAYGTDELTGFYNTNGQRNGNQISVQLAFGITVAVWSFGVSGILFFVLNKIGILRVAENIEMEGVDMAEGMGPAYEKSPALMLSE